MIMFMPSENTFTLKIPFVGKIFNVYKKRRILLFQEKLITKLKHVFTTFKVGAYFSLKSKVEMQMRSNVILNACVVLA